MITLQIKNIMLRTIKKNPSHNIWKNHVTKVVNYSKILAKKLEADKEICEISAWLHDVSKIEGIKNEHHITGAKKARDILTELKYEEEKIKIVEECILTHSSDTKYEPKTLEQKIVASADALALLEDFLLFVYQSAFLKGKTEDEVRKSSIKKLNIAWKKVCLLPEAKKIAEPRYKAIKLLLKKQF